MTDFANALLAVLEEEQIPDLVLIGHSMGGYISMAFAEAFPQKIKALGLFHSSSYADSAEKKESREKNIRFIQKNGGALFVEQAIPGLFSDSFKLEHPEKIRHLVTRYANFTVDPPYCT